MKKTILFLVAVLLSAMTYGQTAKGFNFKALVTNNGNPVANSTITVRVTIKEGSSVKWKEKHTGVNTDANGIFSIIMGEGTRLAGVTTFDKVNWNEDNMKYTVEVNLGSGYQTLINNENFKRVPYAKEAERLAPGAYNVITENSNIWAKNDGSGSIFQGFRLSNGTNDWYINMSNDNGLVIRNDNLDVLKIADGDNSVWIKGRLTATDSGDADMKAYIYGEFNSTASIISAASSSGFTVSKISTGVYRITFSTPMSSNNAYTVVATSYAASLPEFITFSDNHSGYFYLRAWDSSGNPKDTTVFFVVYKK